MMARIYIEYPNGTIRYLAGDSQTRYTIKALAENSKFNSSLLPADTSGTLVVDWKIPRSANNTIQSDQLTFDMELTLQANE
jgi:hypothetical protein